MKSRKKINKKLMLFAVKIPFTAFLYVQYKKMVNRLHFYQDLFRFRRLNDGRFSVKGSDLAPCLLDNTENTDFEPHYTYHPAWAARVLAHTKPSLHVDFSSYLPFSTLVSAFVPIHFYDYRPANIKLDNLQAMKGDLMAIPLADGSVTSLSCMHTIEHIGLGRYGDPIDPEGDLKAIRELKRVLAKGGDFLLVVPMGPPRILFNANRVYSYDQVMEYCSDLRLEEFSLIPSNAVETGIIKNASKETADAEEDCCGCFWFKK